MRVLVLQHIACEPPGAYEDVLLERGARLTRVELDEGQTLPTLDGFDAVVAMGGPMSVNDEAEHPWLVGEKRLIREAAGRGVPFWGACLGVQLLASALGARVYAGPAPEVGVLPVRLTERGRADPVLGRLPAEFGTLQWHGDTFDLPSGAVLLASSDPYPNQAFRFERAYGVQFHLEVSVSMAEAWAEVPAYGEYLDRVLGPGSLPGVIGDVAGRQTEMLDHARTMFAGWLDTTVGARA
ncbi:MAG TPA: type 1 glutamine amidotransferase [Actinomycetota bacterium]|nr:type 1 glutamine amidotransferase [Actinomycetota bacterium]